MKILAKQTVYRLEHKDTREGPYTSTGRSIDVIYMSDSHDTDEDYPAPCQDAGIDREIYESLERCGFESMAQLKSWFSADELKMLKENNFHIVEIPDARITAFGECQVLYIPYDIWKQLDFFQKDELMAGTFC